MIYGENYVVERKECVGHVQERIGLHNAKKQQWWKGAGKLTGAIIINKLDTYYGLAIQRNPESVEEMKNAMWVTKDRPTHHVRMKY